MRSRATTIIVTLILAICLVCPLLEVFDHWDHTAQTGNDTEYTLVILGLCVGVSFTLARAILRMSGRLRSKRTATTDDLLPDLSGGPVNLVVEAFIPASPPLTT